MFTTSRTFLCARSRSIPLRRYLSTTSIPPEIQEWSSPTRSLELHDKLSAERLADLYVTLPTRDGTRSPPFQPPSAGDRLQHGHHLVFCHPRNPESLLRSNDGTDQDFCPPKPFNRRMWAGGKFTWNTDHPLLVGQDVTATAVVRKEAVSYKAFDTDSPMIFVTQKLEYRQTGSSIASILEERKHVYLTSRANSRKPHAVHDLPRADFGFQYTPTATTLFRFSALTFNGHYIHLDKDYAQQIEGYKERLVHGPLSALMLLEALWSHMPSIHLKTFEYRAHNPIVVNQPISIHGAVIDRGRTVKLWCTVEDGVEDGVVGMSGFARCD